MNLHNIFRNNKGRLNESKKHNLPKRFWTKEELGKEEYDRLFNDYLFGRCLTGAEFIDLLDNNFTPFLKELGFKGRKNHFYKTKDNLLFIIGIFKDKYGGEFALNCGVHIVGFPIRGFFDKTEPSKITTNESIIHRTLVLENGNSWLKFGKDKTEGLETVEYMKELISTQGQKFFMEFSNFPKPFSDVTIADFEKPTNKFEKYGISIKMLSWIHFQIFIARYNFEFGDKQLALQIIKYIRDNEYNSDRFTSKGVSPLLLDIDRLIEHWK